MNVDTIAAPRAIPAATAHAVERCPSCAAEAMLDFCGRCGEKRRAETDYSIRRFLGQALHVVTDLDTTVGRTFATLVRHPGRLAAEHFAGRRRLYLGPLQIFLLCNFAYFVVDSVLQIGGLALPLGAHLGARVNGPLLLDLHAADGMTFRELMQNAEAYDAYAREFYRVTSTQAKTLVVLLVPMLASVSILLYGRRERVFAKHLIFALHFFAFFLLLVPAVVLFIGLVVLPAINLLAASPVLFDQKFWDRVLTIPFLGIPMVYFWVAGRSAFGVSRRHAAVAAAVLTGMILPLVMVYRVILFFTTRAMM